MNRARLHSINEKLRTILHVETHMFGEPSSLSYDLVEDVVANASSASQLSKLEGEIDEHYTQTFKNLGSNYLSTRKECYNKQSTLTKIYTEFPNFCKPIGFANLQECVDVYTERHKLTDAINDALVQITLHQIYEGTKSASEGSIVYAKDAKTTSNVTPFKLRT